MSQENRVSECWQWSYPLCAYAVCMYSENRSSKSILAELSQVVWWGRFSIWQQGFERAQITRFNINSENWKNIVEMEPGLVDVLAHERSLMLEISNQLPFQSLVTCHFLFKRIYGRQACSTHNCTCQIRYKETNSETVISMTPNHSILPIHL